MGCVASKKDEDDNVVSLCRERKRLLQLAIERRYAFADAQCKYNQSLCAVAAAIRLFLARHSSSSSSAFLISFPSIEPFMTNYPTLEPISGQPESQKEVKKTEEKLVSHEAFQEKKESESESEEGEVICEHFYDDSIAPPPEPSQGRDFEWDFFYPFDEVLREEVVNRFSQSPDDELRKVWEKEGIPELEEEGERVVMNANNGDMDHEESKGLRVMDTPTNGRELLEALKDVEDYFVRSYDSGLIVSRMLEVNRVRLLSGLEGIKENSNKLMSSATLSRSMSFSSSSCRSLLRSTSRSSSMWTELNDDLFKDYGGMEAGSHLLTLERLYAWEKKLYEEVKAGDKARKIYERRYFHSKKQEQDYKQDSREKNQVKAKDLQSRLFLAIRRAESISERIQTLRDKELQPQLVELLHALKKNWKTMEESYKTQSQIILEVKSYDCPTQGKFGTNSHQLATLQLNAELQNWRACFASYVSTQKSYIEILTCWLSKFIAPELESSTVGRYLTPPWTINGPLLLVICHNWMAYLETLPDKAVIFAMKGFAKDIRALLVQLGEEQRQKKKIDGLAKELERKVLAVHKLETRILESNTFDQKSEAYLENQKHILDMLRKKLDLEKAKHLDDVKETKQITLKGFRTGFYSVFESLAEFSKASENMYAGLVECREIANAAEEMDSELLG
ncbi:hypothetical protein HS088_TW14G00043 [Tripterygium wilfordii]|uniref:Uncharacterized protein n=1 Tax=Tripterygium wilfordii TaxID=458696 RepID=A0A7J7CP98_TRIWF|nr:protein ALTERED PHOSPHATE STARVATION RESPONSE 1-like [Tripterygium wilfordii]KAF5735913.1 hypothetical protein HS088_TW14G00043 [Tripterygium wilfordii]